MYTGVCDELKRVRNEKSINKDKERETEKEDEFNYILHQFCWFD